MNGIKYVRPGNGFTPNFTLFKKGDVNGKDEHPMYTYLKKHCAPPREKFSSKYRLMYDDFQINDIRWNWEKFLISKEGKPIWRISPDTIPEDFVEDVENLVAEKSF